MVKAYSNPEEDEENNQEAEGQPTAVQWALPSNPDDFHMYINHGCTLDSQNYPIYPNGQTIFVKTPDMDIKNFGTIGFTKTLGVKKQSKNTWKILQYYCLVVMVCNIDTCQWVGLPLTAPGSINKLLAR